MRQQVSGYQSDFDRLEVPLIIVAADRLIAYANPAARRLFGAAPGALEGAGIDRLVVSERRGELRNIEDVLKGGSARRVRSVLRREDGGRIDVTMSVEPSLDAAGRVEAATVRYELIAASGRMSAAPNARTESRFSTPRPPAAPEGMHAGIKTEPDSDVSHSPSGRPLVSTFSSGVEPTASTSEPFQNPRPFSVELEPRLLRVAGHLSWLDERLSQPATEAPLDDVRERARALMVIAEARAQLRLALEEVRNAKASVPPLPAPPKLPTL